MSEVEFDDGESLVAEPEVETPEPEIEAPEAEAKEPEAETEKPKEKVKFDDAQQEVLNAAVAEKAFQVREQKRQNEELQAQLAALQSQQQAQEPQGRPELPPFPDDTFADDYQQKVEDYNKAIAAQAQYDVVENLKSQVALQQQQQVQQEQAQKAEAALKSWNEKVEKLNIAPEAMDAAYATLDTFEINPAVAARIGKEATGPQIAQYLAKNPTEIEKLVAMEPDDAVIHIATTIRKKAAEGRKSKALPDDPAESLNGKGSPEGVDPILKGAVFE